MTPKDSIARLPPDNDVEEYYRLEVLSYDQWMRAGTISLFVPSGHVATLADAARTSSPPFFGNLKPALSVDTDDPCITFWPTPPTRKRQKHNDCRSHQTAPIGNRFGHVPLVRLAFGAHSSHFDDTIVSPRDRVREQERGIRLPAMRKSTTHARPRARRCHRLAQVLVIL